MAKAKLELRILDLGKIEALKDLINELLDVIETLQIVDDDGWSINEIQKKRKEYINRFADIISDNEK